jgi:uncharacterized membrane protein
MMPDPLESLQTELSELRARVARLEEASLTWEPRDSSQAPPPRPEPAVEAFHISREELPLPVCVAPSSPPSFGALASSDAPEFLLSEEPVSDTDLLENRIGSQWFNRIGILAVLMGMAWFLKLAIDNHWIGPAGRVMIGLVSGAGAIVWSQRFRQHGYVAFSYSLNAIGSGTLYLSLWAASQLYHLLPSGAAFAMMVVVTAFNGYMAWEQDAELLALYSIVGCLSTPLLLSTGENHQVILFSYLLLMNLAVLCLSVLRPWSRLLFTAFVGTMLFFVGWWGSFYTDVQAMHTAFFSGCFFVIFALAPRLVRPRLVPSDAGNGWDVLAQLILPIANAVFGFLCFYNLLDQPGLEWAHPWLAVAMAAFYLLLLQLPETDHLHAGSSLLASLHLSTAIVFLTIAIPLKMHGRWLTVGWLVEGAALLWVARRDRSNLLQLLSVGCLLLGLVALFTGNPDAAPTPVFNQRFATYAVAIFTFAFVAWTTWQACLNQSEDAPPPLLPWLNVAVGGVLLVNLLVLLAVGLEIDVFWWHRVWQGDGRRLEDFRMYAQFTYSAWFMLYGVFLLVLGIARKSAFTRWQALVLLVVATGKVFLVDVSALSAGFRIVSFLGMGALLLGVSYVYQRDCLHLSAKSKEREA